MGPCVRPAPGRASFQTILCLLSFLCPEVFKGNRRLGGPGVATLGGWGKEVFTAARLLLLELLTNGDPPPLKVHLLPRQAQALPPSAVRRTGKGRKHCAWGNPLWRRGTRGSHCPTEV